MSRTISKALQGAPRTGGGRCVLALLCVTLQAVAAHAGGLYLGEYATPSSGTANAGAEALGRDAEVGPLGEFHGRAVARLRRERRRTRERNPRVVARPADGPPPRALRRG